MLRKPTNEPTADGRFVGITTVTAAQWRAANPKLDGNMRESATIEQLLVLANIEGMNAEFIHMNLPQGERLKRLSEIAIRHFKNLRAAMTAQVPPILTKSSDKHARTLL